MLALVLIASLQPANQLSTSTRVIEFIGTDSRPRANNFKYHSNIFTERSRRFAALSAAIVSSSYQHQFDFCHNSATIEGIKTPKTPVKSTKYQ